jgi:hypothetical protein
MLRAGAGVWRSSRYASNLESWYATLPPEHFHITTLEKLETRGDAELEALLHFLSLPSAVRPRREAKPLCTAGVAGVLDASDGTAAWRAGAIQGTSDEGGTGGTAIVDCEPSEDKALGKDGVSRYKIDGATEALLKEFFRPYNERLFALVGRVFHEWA